MDEGPFYSVILISNDDFDPRKLADVLSRALAIPQFDAITRLRQNWGMLYRTQEEGKARELQQKLGQEGIKTFILDDPRYYRQRRL